MTGNVYVGLHDFEEMAFLLHYLRRTDLFVDVGANAGSYTILASAVVGARSISFEPIPKTFSLLVNNIRLNEIEDRAVAMNIGLAGFEGNVVFSADGDTTNHVLSTAEASAQSIAVPVSTLDEQLAELAPALIKIDVEGFEAPIVDGGRSVLGGDRPLAVIMELNGSGDRYGHDEGSLLQTMRHLGFRAFRYHPFERKLESLEGSNAKSGNTLFIRNHEFALERVRQGQAFSLFGHQV